MKTTSPLYRELREARGSWYETQVVRGGVVYGDNVRNPYQKNIHKLDINPALFDDGGPQIGIARASKCKLEIFESSDNWPRMASFLVRMRIHSDDDSRVSEWIPMGTFWTDRRVPDDTGYLSITAYDGMLLLEQSWTDKVAQLPTNWPITAKAAAALLEEATGIELENDDILDDVVAFIGLNTRSTARDVWSDIAAAHGCNLQLTPLGKLRLVELARLPGTAYTGAVADIAIADYAIADTDGGGLLPSDYFDLGFDVSGMAPGNDLPEITGVELRSETGAKAFAGDKSGYVLKGVCNFSNSEAAALCLSRMQNRFYRPFNATTAFSIDPAADPGDLVSIEGMIYQVMAITWTICAKPTADLSAEFEEEIDHEYLVQSSGGKTLRIAISAACQYADEQLQNFLEGDFADTVEALQGQIDGKAQTWYQATDPAQGWTTEEKAEHAGDLWYRTTDATSWRYTGSAWSRMDVPDEVFDKIDGKAQIFVRQPVPPYDVGDLWFGGTGADIKTCTTARATGSYVAADWVKYNKYTDDTAANAVAQALQTFINGSYKDTVEALQGQIDGKAQTWYQAADPAQGWTAEEKAEHAGDLWYRTTDATSWRYTGSAWSRMDVPDEVFDKIDGKAQIFVRQPVPPYAVGDLWFGGTGADIKTCTTARATGSYVAADWVKYNKYTDDTAANAVARNLQDNYLTAVETRSYIDQQANSIRSGVAAVYVSNEALSDALAGYSPTEQIEQNYYSKTQADQQADALASEINLTDQRLTIAFSQLRADTNDAINAMSYYIRYENGVVIVGKTDSPTSIRISNDQIGLFYGEEMLSYWNENRQFTPKELQIPEGGKFTLGKVLWQPRTSGNLSLMWVG